MPFANIDGLNTYYEIHGRGDTVVLLHNGFSCTKMWQEITPGLCDAGYRVVTFDRRGYGRSDPGPDFEAFYTGEGFRAANVTAMAALMAQLGMDRFHIVGQCEGGVVGVDYACRYPGQVKTLTTASTLCYCHTTLEVFNSRKFPAGFDRLTPEIQHKYVDWHGERRAEYVYSLFSRYGGEYGRYMFDLRETLGSVRCPSLVMYPDRGHFFEVEQGMAFFRHLPNGELAVFPRCGHNIHEHYPAEYVRQVVLFLGRNGKEAD